MPKVKEVEREWNEIMMDVHMKARELSQQTFGQSAPSRAFINAVAAHIIEMDDEGEVDEKATQVSLRRYLETEEPIARKIATELFETTPSQETVLGVACRVIYADDDDELVAEDIETATADLIASCGWAREVYGDGGPAATFEAYDIAFDLDDE